MRENFAADWAFAIQGAIENVVTQSFPFQLRQWPLLQSFNFEAYQVGDDHFVMVLRDKLSGMIAGPGEPQPFPHETHPPLPVSPENVSQWRSYLVERFSLRNEDIAMVLPIHDSGRSDATADYEMFSDDEKAVWNDQLQLAIARQKAALQAPDPVPPDQPAHVTYIVSGTNARVNIDSSDSSVNVVDQTPHELFQQLIAAVQNTAADPDLVATMVAAVEAMQREHGSDTFYDHYRTFMGILADHMQVFGPVVAPYLPMLAQLLQ